MQRRVAVVPPSFWDSQLAGVHTGNVVRITSEGRALVEFPGNQLGPVEARSITQITAAQPGKVEMPVLLVFENGDPKLPIIVGLIGNRFLANSEAISGCRDVVVEGRTIVFDASSEVILRCGKSSVSLRSDGKIGTKGTEIVSRSSGNQKIRGGSVQIN